MVAKVFPFSAQAKGRGQALPEQEHSSRHTTSELVTLAQSGEQGALRSLFDAHVNRVHHLCRLLLPHQTDVDDVVQDVFVRAIESLPRLRDAGAFPGWLRAITVHVVRNRIRHERFLRRIGLRASESEPNDLLLDRLVARDAPPDVRAELMAVYRAMQKLDADARAALVLQRLQGLTLPEIAEALGVSLSTAKRRLATADAELSADVEGER